MGRKPKVRTPTPDEVFQVGRSVSTHYRTTILKGRSFAEVILAARVNEDSEWVSVTLHRVDSVLPKLKSVCP